MKKNQSLLISFFMFVSFFFCTCNIGLGEAVDTKSPTANITLPELGSSIRETLVLTGTWQDDTKVTKVVVSLKSEDSDAVYSDYIGEVEPRGTWIVKIPTVDKESGKKIIQDGNYEATVTVYDTYNQTGVVSRSLSIDNTPPLVVLQTPGSRENETLTDFGQKFYLKGTATDDSKLDRLEINVFDKEGNKKTSAPVVLENVKDGFEKIVARWSSAEGNAYKEMYGSDMNQGKKNFYCTIDSFDGTIRWNEPTLSYVKDGNKANFVYLYNDVYTKATSILSDSGAYAVLSGTSKGPDSQITQEEYNNAVSILNNPANLIQKSYFTLNPRNNPYFEVSGYETIKSLKENYNKDTAKKPLLDSNEFANGGNINVTLFMGADAVPFESGRDTFGLYFVECNADGSEKTDGKKVAILNPVLEKDETTGEWKTLTEEEKKVRIEKRDACIRQTGENFVISCKIRNMDYTDLKAGAYYKIVAVGYDQNGNELDNGVLGEEHEYAIKFTDNLFPTVKITKPGDSINIGKNREIEIEGTAIIETGDIELFAYINDSKDSEPFATSVNNGGISFDSKTNVFKLKVSSDLIKKVCNNTNGSFKVVVEAGLKDVEGQRGSAAVQVENDVEDPEIKQIDIIPISEEKVGETTTKFVNGTITVTPLVTDNRIISSIHYTLTQDGGAEGSKISVESTTSPRFTIKTSDFEDNKNLKLKLYVKDNSGNEVTKEEIITINQQKDRPEISLSNAILTDKIEDIKEETNIFGTQTNNKLLGTVVDDDGIDTITIAYKKYSETTYSAEKTKVISGAGRTSYPVNYELPKEEGEYTIKIDVKDSKGETSYSNATEDFVLAVDNGAPNFVITTANDALHAANAALPINGIWKDGTNKVTIARYVKDAEGNLTEEVNSSQENSSIKIDFTNGSWSDTIPATIVGLNGGTRYYKAWDKYNLISEQYITFKVDSLPPVLTDIKTDNIIGSGKFINPSKILGISGKIHEKDPDVNDPNNEGSGLENLYYKVSTNTTEAFSKETETSWTKVNISKSEKETGDSETGTWSANINISAGYNEGTKYYVHVAAKDKANNYSLVTTEEFNVDKTIPVVDSFKTSITGINGSTSGNVVLTGNTSDALSGIAEVLLYENGTATSYVAKLGENGAYSFEIPVEKISNGSHTYTFIARDSVGNENAEKTVTVTADKVDPEISISTISPTVLDENKNATVNGKITVSGTVKDETGLKEIRWFFGTVPTDYEPVEGQNQTFETTYENYNIEVDTTMLEDNKTTIMTIVVFDNANNATTITRDLNVNQSLDKPVVALSNADVSIYDVDGIVKTDGKKNVYGTLTNNKILGTITDDDQIESITIVVKAEDGTEKQNILINGDDGKGINSATYNFSHELPAEEGTYTVKITVQDTKNETGDNSKTTIKPFTIAVDNGAPVLEIKSTRNAFLPAGQTVQISGTLDDTAQGTSIAYYSDKDCTTKVKDITLAENWTTDLVVGEGESGTITIYVKATDKYGQSTIRDYPYRVDSIKPTFTIEKVNGDEDLTKEKYYGNKNKNFTVTGTVSDEGGSDLDENVYYKLIESSQTIDYSSVESWSKINIETISGKTTWTAKLDFNTTDFEEGKTYKLLLSVKDRAGNFSEPTENPTGKVNIFIDSIEPTVTFINPDPTKLKVEASDGTVGSGLASIVLYNNDVKFAETTEATKEFDISGSSIIKAGRNELKVVVTDVAGNSKTSESIVITNTKPSLTVTSSIAENNKKDGYLYSNGDITVTLKVQDENQLTSLVWTDTSAGESSVVVTNNASEQSVTNSITKASANTSGATRTYTATNVYGLTTSVDFKYIFDVTKPTLAITSLNGDSDTTKTEYYGNQSSYFTVKGTVNDSEQNASGLGDSVYYKLISSNETPDYSSVESWSKVGISGNSWTATLDFSTTEFTEGEKYKLLLAVKDRAGNFSEPIANPTTICIDSTPPTVDEFTKEDYTTLKVIASDSRSGLSNIVLYNNSKKINVTPASSIDSTGKTTYTYDLSEKDTNGKNKYILEGTNEFKVEITDGAGNSTTSGNIEIANTKPTLTVTSSIDEKYKKNEYLYSNKDITVTLKVKDVNQLTSLNWNDTSSSTGSVTVTNDSSEQTVLDSINSTVNTSGATRTYTATNVYGLTTSVEFKYIFDVTKPTFAITSLNGETINSSSDIKETYYGNKTSYFAVKGTVKDEENGSGLGENVYYKLIESNQTDDYSSIYSSISDDDWTKVSILKNGSWTAQLDFEAFEENKSYVLLVSIKDNAENFSNPTENPTEKVKIYLDSTAPNVTFTKEDPTKLKVVAEDSGSGLANIVLYNNDEEIETTTSGTKEFVISGNGIIKKGKNDLKVVVTDKAGNRKTSDIITIENTAPTLQITSDFEAAGKYKTTNGHFYFNDTIELQLKVKDDNRLTSLVWKDASTNGSINVKSDASEQNVSNSITKPNADTTELTRTYTATNVYGLTTNVDFRYIFDVTKPVLNTRTDNGKPYSTIGEISLGSEFTDIWFNSENLVLDGRFTESGSGISEIKYTLNDGNEDKIISSKKEGYETFKSTISGFEEKAEGYSNKFKIWAVDYAGNKSEEKEYAIKVDTTTPKLSDLEFKLDGDTNYSSASSVILSNKTKDITIKGKYSDESDYGYGSSGIDSNSITIKVGTKDILATIKDDGTWSLTIQKEDLSNLSGSRNLTITVKDKAGNIDSNTTVTLQIDTEAPEVVVNSPKANATLNGLVSFNGNLKENYSPKSIQLYYYFSTATTPTVPTALSGWTTRDNLLISKTNGADDTAIKNWKFENYNVNDLLGNSTAGKLYILPVAYDQAGNCNISANIASSNYVSYTVDLDSDRPTIKFQNLSSASGSFLKYTTELTGTITDDDGVSLLKIANQKEKPTDWTSVLEVELNSGSFSFDLGEDGSKTLWFYIEDIAGGKFETSSEKTVKQPKVLFKGAPTAVDNNSVISFKTDSNPPVLGNPLFSYGSSSSVEAPSTEMGLTNIVGGTERKKVRFGIQATDTNGIASVKVKGLSSNDISLTYSSDNKYYSNVQDVSSYEGTKTLTFEVTDNSEIVTSVQKQITFDNKAPTLEIINPVPTDVVTGTVPITGTTSDEYSGITVVKYLVVNNNNGNSSSNDFVEFTNLGSSLNSWKFNLEGLPSNDEDLEDYSNITPINGIYTLPIYFYVEDSLGNGTIIKDKTIKYNPFGDRPTAEINYPTGTQTERANVNGAIRVTGAASDNVSVKEVYIQLDVNNDGEFTDADKDILDGCKDGETSIYKIVTSISDSDMSAIDNNFWGIKVNGTNSWNYTINKFSELLMDGNKVAEGKYAVNIRAVAVDENNKFGNWSEIQYVEFDTNIPTIGKRNKNVIEYAEDGTTVKATKAYISDMYLKGTAALELSVEDKEGIKQVMYYVAATEEGLASAKGTKLNDLGTEQIWDSGETKGYIVKIPLNANSKYVKVVATKDSDTETTAYEKFSVNFDNSAPRLRNKISLNGVKYDDSDKKVVNSNGTYFTIASEVEDDGGSGFDKFVFYYYREGKSGNPNRIYNPMIDSASLNAGQPINEGRVNINDLNSMEIAGKSIYGSKQTVNINADKRTITLVNESDHIREGGLVNIDGNWITIESVSGTSVTLKTDSSVTGSVEAFFAYAQVIDNTGSEKTNASGDLTSGDDGDQMAESIIKNLNVWTVDASFHSNYIPDGPGKFVVFAFDKAGNVVSGEYDASVQNNAPRLTRVMLATDLNGDNQYQYDNSNGDPVNNLSENATANGAEFGEFAFYSTLNNMGEASNIATVSLPAGRDAFIVKNKLLVVPEFVGGNGDLQYTYKIADTLEDATMSKNSDENIDLKPFDSNVVIDNVKGNFDDSKTTIKDVEGNTLATTSKKFVLSNDNFAGKESWTKEGKGTKYLAATFWDSTPETTQGEDSCYALLKMPIIVNIEDDTVPTAHIIPFYWNSKEDGSFVYENGNPLGHIDIEQNPTKDTRPGVSGEVYIEGEAWDDTRLGGIWMTTPGTNETYQVAKYEGGTWSKVTDDWPENWKNFEILKDYGIKQGGHTVKWRFHVNMTPYGIKSNQSVSVQAKDAKEGTANVSAENFVQTVKDALTPTYKMDFVPYIKSIYATEIGSANRSRLGKFPVRAGADMTIEGMNFAKGANYTVNFYKSNASGTGPGTLVSGETVTDTISTDGQIVVTAPQYSRWVEVIVSGQTTQNNKNENLGCNIEAGYVASDYDPETKQGDKGLGKANDAGTNFWTDDRYISVWNVVTTFDNRSKPIGGMIRKANSDSLRRVSSISGEEWKANTTSKDSILATWASIDNLQLYDTIVDTKTNHGTGATISINEATFYEAPPYFDMCVIDNVPWYVALDNYVGNNSATDWGMGLFVARAGVKFIKGTYGTNSQDNCCIERQGKDKYMNATSADGWDSKKNQFINPSINGYKDSTTGRHYVYISYYDSYARCLKYAAYYEDGIDNLNGSNRVQTNSGSYSSLKVLRRAFDDMDGGKTVVAGYDTLRKNENEFKEEAGEWSKVLIDGTEPVIVYYNKTNRCVEIARPADENDNAPGSGNVRSSTGTLSTDIASTVWTKTTDVKPDGTSDFGRYLSAEMDAKGNIHLVSSDNDTGRLYYMYLEKSGKTYVTKEDVLIDATASVGNWTDIYLSNDNADNSNWYDYKPCVSYLNKGKLNTRAAVKVAYIEGSVFETITDASEFEAQDARTTVLGNVKESVGDTKTTPIAVGFNSNEYAVDFLRGEE